MTITEKELAEKVTAVYHEGSDLEAIMRNIARTAAELLGVPLAPEKPEPGWYVVESGQYFGCGAQVVNGRLGVYASGLSLPVFYHEHNTWPELRRMVPEPARVVPAEPVELSEAEIEGLYNGQRYGQARLFNSLHEDVRGTIGAAIHDALREHGHGRAEVTRDQVRDAIDDRVRWLGPQYAGEVADAVMPLLGGGDRG